MSNFRTTASIVSIGRRSDEQLGTFDIYVESQVAPNLRANDLIIRDKLASHKSSKAGDAMRAVATLFLCLPPYSANPDLNEVAFSELKVPIRLAIG